MSGSSYKVVKAWREKNKDKVNEQARRYRIKHPDKIKVIRKRYRINHLEELLEKDKNQQALYRKTDKYKQAQSIRNRRHKDKIKKAQEILAGKLKTDICEICKKKEGGRLGRIVFDHCHLTGKFRGWICDRCNRTLGQVEDNILLLQAMIDYLKN